MDQGLIVEENTPDEIFFNPQNERTKVFLTKCFNKTALHKYYIKIQYSSLNTWN